MKVLVFGAIAGHGGIQSHLRWLTRALVEAGMEVLILTPQNLEKYDRETFSLEGIQIHSIYANPIDSPNKILRTLHQFQNTARIARNFQPHLYLGVGTSWHLSLLSLFLPKTVCSIFHEVMSGMGGRWQDARWGVRLWFDEVVGQSPTVAANFVETFRWPKPVRSLPAIPEPLELTTSLPQPPTHTVAMGTAKAALFSRLVPWKQAFWLVRQWDALQDILGELHIYGSGPEETPIREYIAKRAIGDRVQCFGGYPAGQAYLDLLSRYDLTLLPTIGPEGAPLVLLESMACGVPFVAYGVGGIPDYGVDNPNAIVVPPEPWLTDQAREYNTTQDARDPPAFIAGVRQMAQKLALGEIDRAQLQQFYLERYSYTVLKKAWLSYLGNLASTRS